MVRKSTQDLYEMSLENYPEESANTTDWTKVPENQKEEKLILLYVMIFL